MSRQTPLVDHSTARSPRAPTRVDPVVIVQLVLGLAMVLLVVATVWLLRVIGGV